VDFSVVRAKRRLADFGAEVIKTELPEVGDPADPRRMRSPARACHCRRVGSSVVRVITRR
jgi:crotonobetainyl-CoA:carnitine CoA-transferase CaiB-like acyl-CoA transferase